jgi:hypothetical protein
MACNECDKLVDVTDLSLPYVVRTCNKCGREIKLRTLGAHGIGYKIESNELFVIPAGFLKLSANPLESSGQFTSYGLSRFAEMVFGIDIASQQDRENFPAAIHKIMENIAQSLKNAESLRDLDLDDPENLEEISKRIDANPKSAEWFGYMAAGACSMALHAIEDGNAEEAAWAMATAERLRAIAIFKSNFEETVFMGHSARPLIDFIRTWDANKTNSDEAFWHIKLRENAFAISQLFSVPVALIQDKAYMGGMSLDQKDARLLDFLYSGGSANEAILVEIKTPMTRLLGGKYRKNVYSPSAELSGSIVQVNDYCDSLRANIDKLLRNKPELRLNTFNPRRIIIIGNYERELTDEIKQKSFELYRSCLTGTDVITFDEFFQKIEHLARLFNLIRDATLSKGPQM